MIIAKVSTHGRRVDRIVFGEEEIMEKTDGAMLKYPSDKILCYESKECLMALFQNMTSRLIALGGVNKLTERYEDEQGIIVERNHWFKYKY